MSSPPRRDRWKRSSHDDLDKPEPLIPSPKDSLKFVAGNHTVWLATFVVAWVWFSHVVLPWASIGPSSTEPAAMPRINSVRRVDNAGLLLSIGMAPYLSSDVNFASAVHAEPQKAAPDTQSFVATCALVHTFIVGVGIALGRDTLGHSLLLPFLRLSVGIFSLLCAVLYWAWEWKVGPVPPVGELLFSSEASFVIVGAASMTAWLAASMLLQHSAIGRLCTRSTLLHVLLMASGFALEAMDAPLAPSLGCFAAASATFAAVSYYRAPDIHARVSV